MSLPRHRMNGLKTLRGSLDVDGGRYIFRFVELASKDTRGLVCNLSFRNATGANEFQKREDNIDNEGIGWLTLGVSVVKVENTILEVNGLGQDVCFKVST